MKSGRVTRFQRMVIAAAVVGAVLAPAIPLAQAAAAPPPKLEDVAIVLGARTGQVGVRRHALAP